MEKTALRVLALILSFSLVADPATVSAAVPLISSPVVKNPGLATSELFSSEALTPFLRWIHLLKVRGRDTFRQTRLPEEVRSAGAERVSAQPARIFPRLEWSTIQIPIFPLPRLAGDAGVLGGWDGTIALTVPRFHFSPNSFMADSDSRELLLGGGHPVVGAHHWPTAPDLKLASRASDVNAEIAKKMKARLDVARKRGLFGVMSVAMELPLVDAHGKKLKRLGPGGGGQGVYMSEQPRAIVEEGVAATIVTPLVYADVMANYGSLEAYLRAYNGKKVMNLSLPINGGMVPLEVYDIEQHGVPVLQLFDPSGHFFHTLYDIPHPDSIGAYIESVLLPLAAIEITRHLDAHFEVFHFNDWQTALGPVFLSELYRTQTWDLPYGKTPAAVFTVHNLEYQGLFPNDRSRGWGTGEMSFQLDKPDEVELRRYLMQLEVIGPLNQVDIFALTNLNPALRNRTEGGLEYWSQQIPGRHNFFKGGAQFAHRLMFVSEGHAKEALTQKRGYGQDGLLRALQSKITYVYNGIHAQNHRPENLSALDDKGRDSQGHEYAFSRPAKRLATMVGPELLAWKKAQKRAFQTKLGLEVNDNHIIMGFVTRIVKQKGLNILMTPLADGKTLMEHLLDLRHPVTGAKVQIPILGTSGDPRGEVQAAFFRNFLTNHPRYKGQFIFIEKFDPSIAKQIGAAADLMGMFSIDEPGGIANQEIALLLAMVLASNRGGLKDFKDNGGTPLPLFDGFEIDDTPEADRERQHSASQIIDIVNTCLKVYQDSPEKWGKELETLTRFKPDWGNRAGNYVDAYIDAIESANPGYRALTDGIRLAKRRRSPELGKFLEDVKIPDYARPSTTELIKKMREKEHKHKFEGARVLVYGIGSEAISVYAAALGAREVIVIDPSDEVLTRTSKNAAGEGLVERVIPVKRHIVDDDLSDLIQREKFDVILANLPPYHDADQSTAVKEPTVADLALRDEKGRLFHAYLARLVQSMMNLDGMSLAFMERRQDYLKAASGVPGFTARFLIHRGLKTGEQAVLEMAPKKVRPIIPGALGFWGRWDVHDLKIVGLLEGLLTGLSAFIGLMRVLPHRPDVIYGTQMGWHIAGFLALGYLGLVAAHYFFGVQMTPRTSPVHRDFQLSVRAAARAAIGFAGAPLFVIASLTTPFVGFFFVIAGLTFGALGHAALNPGPLEGRKQVLAMLRSGWFEVGLHTVTAGRGHSVLSTVELVTMAKALLSRGFMPAVDRIDVLRALREDPTYNGGLIAFLCEGQPQLARDAAACGANVLMGGGLIPEVIEGIRRRYPHVVIISEISHTEKMPDNSIRLRSDDEVSGDLEAADRTNVDGVMLKPYLNPGQTWDTRFPAGPLSIAGIHDRYPSFLLMVAGGIYQDKLYGVLRGGVPLVPAVGFNPAASFAVQLAEYDFERMVGNAAQVSGDIVVDLPSWSPLNISQQQDLLNRVRSRLEQRDSSRAAVLLDPLEEGRPLHLALVPKKPLSGSASALGRGLGAQIQDHSLINGPIQKAFEEGRTLEIRWSAELTNFSVNLGPNVDPSLIDQRLVVDTLKSALEAGGNETRELGRLVLIVPEVPEAAEFVFYEHAHRFVYSHGGRGPGYPTPTAYLTYPFFALLAHANNPMAKRAVQLILKHELEHGRQKIAGNPEWEDPIAVNEILSLLAHLGILKVPTGSFLPITDRKSLLQAYKAVWDATTRMVEAGQVPKPLKDAEVHSIALVGGGADMSPTFLDALDRVDAEMNDLDPQFHQLFVGVPRKEKHLSIAWMILDWLGGPVSLAMVSAAQREEIAKVLKAQPSVRVRFTGLNLGPDGVLFAEGHLDDESLFDIKTALKSIFPDPYSRTPMIHITLSRPIGQLTSEQFKRYYDWVARSRQRSLGEITITRPFLRQTNSRFGLFDLAPERISFEMGSKLTNESLPASKATFLGEQNLSLEVANSELLHPQASAFLKGLPEGRILNGGPEDGGVVRWFHERGRAVVGMDSSESIFKHSSPANDSHDAWVRSDMKAMPFVSHSFAGVWLMGLESHFLKTAELRATLSESYRALIGDGRIFISVSKEVGLAVQADGRTYRPFDEMDLRTLVEEAGFRILESGTKSTGRSEWVYIMAKAPSVLERFLRALETFGRVRFNGIPAKVGRNPIEEGHEPSVMKKIRTAA